MSRVSVHVVVRLAEYDSALAFYFRLLGRGIYQIVFSENSDADLRPLQKQLAESDTLE